MSRSNAPSRWKMLLYFLLGALLAILLIYISRNARCCVFVLQSV